MAGLLLFLRVAETSEQREEDMLCRWEGMLVDLEAASAEEDLGAVFMRAGAVSRPTRAEVPEGTAEAGDEPRWFEELS